MQTNIGYFDVDFRENTMTAHTWTVIVPFAERLPETFKLRPEEFLRL